MSGWSNQAEAAVPGAKSTSKTIGSGGTVHLIKASDNPNGLTLWSVSISSAASASGTSPPGNSFMVEDTVTDSDGGQYLACQIGMGQGVGGSAENSVSQNMFGIDVPAGASLDLNNGGAGGTAALRQCSATVIYQVIS